MTHGPDDEREVALDDDTPVLADRAGADDDAAWGDWRAESSNDARLRADVPPHWG